MLLIVMVLPWTLRSLAPWRFRSDLRSLPSSRARATALPEGDGWAYEPKWDGFRALAFVDGELLELQSRGGRPLGRYFPELTFPPGRYVIDGEIVIDGADGLQDFDALSNRIHPAASRIELLSRETPARFLAFDLLARDDESLLELPFAAAARGAGGASRSRRRSS